MFSESFDIKFSRVACVLYELRHLPPKIFQSLPGMKNSIFKKKIFAMGFCDDFHSVNRINKSLRKK